MKNIKLFPVEQNFDEELRKVCLWFNELRDNPEVERQKETPMLPGNYLAEINSTYKSSDTGTEIEPHFPVFPPEWENHAPSMASTSQAPTTTMTKFSNSTKSN